MTQALNHTADPLAQLREIMGEDINGRLYVGAAPHSAIVASKRVADFVVSEGAVEVVARLLRHAPLLRLGKGHIIDKEHPPSDNDLDTARRVLTLIASAGVSDHG